MGFAAAAAILVVLAIGITLTAWQAVRATRAEREQNRLRGQAETEAAKATAISDFLQQMLGSVNPDALKGAEYSVRQMLDDFSRVWRTSLKASPRLRRPVRHHREGLLPARLSPTKHWPIMNVR